MRNVGKLAIELERTKYGWIFESILSTPPEGTLKSWNGKYYQTKEQAMAAADQYFLDFKKETGNKVNFQQI